jgi:hypothetical protein
MEYTTQELDRSTGDLKTVSLGEWFTVSELAEHYGVGKKRFRIILHHMGLLGQEKDGRYMLFLDTIKKGLGKRLKGKEGYPFNVLSPMCQSLIAEAWKDTVADLEADEALAVNEHTKSARQALDLFKAARPEREWTTREEVSWLAYYHPWLSHRQIAEVLDISQVMVSRYLRQAEAQRSKLTDKRNTPVPDLGPIKPHLLDAEGWSDFAKYL